MSVNAYQLHVLVLPEDDANRQIVNGFLLDPSLNERAIQVLPIAGGWAKVRDDFVTVHVPQLRKYPKRHLVLLIDFDGQVDDRMQIFQKACPADVRERVYLLGTQDEPEPLRKACGVSLEKIGEQLGQACAAGAVGLWGHTMLVHNQAELQRLIENVKPFLFR
ncbi:MULTISPECIES: hypothetical protein [Giesbergeria]|uniref:Uncharacterized protein n=1 Tax=Giesbergeria anulus TaxID=180197 RepID=A0A1H9SM46_9BURK|nr:MULTISPECIES: hypothetical protein [Giesbergeria]MDD2610960.1 hypothetical protein [Giesbergeria sp.]SER85795.1 hypothetical protein SAMN02982919_03162 [Giesbergeria anulus]